MGVGSTWATPYDVRSRWIGSDTLPDNGVIQTWLDDAETLIVAEYPDLPARIADDTTGALLTNVRYVEIQLVSQALKNPDGVRQKSQTAGVFTNSTTYGSETITQAMALTPAHRVLLSGRAKRAFGLDMTVEAPPPNPLEGAVINGPLGYGPGGL